jgi:hypothetical protein
VWEGGREGGKRSTRRNAEQRPIETPPTSSKGNEETCNRSVEKSSSYLDDTQWGNLHRCSLQEAMCFQSSFIPMQFGYPWGQRPST